MESNRIDQFVIFQMEKVIKRYRQVASESFKKTGIKITVDQWIVLKQISENSGSSQVGIARSTVKDAPTTTRIIDQLLSKKLIIKQLDPEDRRQYMVFPTEKGNVLIRKLLPVVNDYRDQCLKGISASDIENIQHFLNRILGNLEDKK